MMFNYLSKYILIVLYFYTTMDAKAFRNMVQGPGEDGPGTTKTKLTPAAKQDWNKFIDYLDAKGMRGNPALDDRNTDLGRKMLGQYKAANPKSGITYEMIPQVQQELQDYRAEALKKIQAGGASAGGVQPDQFMPGLSQVDGWLGQKTSNWQFPKATLMDNAKQVDYGTDTEAYDKRMSASKYRKAVPAKAGVNVDANLRESME
jgi:hypothetical protein